MKNLKTFENFLNESEDSSLFDMLDNNSQNILIEMKALSNTEPSLLYAEDIDDGPLNPIGGGNPYYKCKYCGRTNVEISINGHYRSCGWLKLFKDFDMLKSQLPKEVQDNLSDYLDEI